MLTCYLFECTCLLLFQIKLRYEQCPCLCTNYQHHPQSNVYPISLRPPRDHAGGAEQHDGKFPLPVGQTRRTNDGPGISNACSFGGPQQPLWWTSSMLPSKYLLRNSPYRALLHCDRAHRPSSRQHENGKYERRMRSSGGHYVSLRRKDELFSKDPSEDRLGLGIP